MSHHYARDLEYMKALLNSPAGYIGMLGPRARTERMIADINSSGASIENSERLFAPVGLDVGGEGPDGIALSIIAEVSAVMTGTTGRHLRDRLGGLHATPRSIPEEDKADSAHT
jgi:xanthine/CO dehydrogenase XdhC/CoxF family maturation factor